MCCIQKIEWDVLGVSSAIVLEEPEESNRRTCDKELRIAAGPDVEFCRAQQDKEKALRIRSVTCFGVQTRTAFILMARTEGLLGAAAVCPLASIRRRIETSPEIRTGFPRTISFQTCENTLAKGHQTGLHVKDTGKLTLVLAIYYCVARSLTLFASVEIMTPTLLFFVFIKLKRNK